jgi:hypothetical protein
LVKAAAPARKSSQPGSMAGITSGGGAAAQCERRVLPRLEGRASTEGRGKLFLTLVATGRSAGVGERGRRSSSARRKKTATRRQWKQARSTTAVPVPPMGGSGLRAERRSHVRPPTPSPPFSSSSGMRVCGQGNGSPEAARVGESRGLRWWLLIAMGALGHVVSHDAAAAREGMPLQRHGGLPGALARRRQRKGKSRG